MDGCVFFKIGENANGNSSNTNGKVGRDVCHDTLKFVNPILNHGASQLAKDSKLSKTADPAPWRRVRLPDRNGPITLPAAYPFKIS